VPADSSCTFCQIVAGSLPAEIVLEDAYSLAFLDRRPLFPGHCLLVPRRHIETLADLPDELLTPLMANARVLARAVETGLAADGSFVAINNRVSQSVPHLHVHVVPRRAGDGLRGFFWPRQRYSDPDEMMRVAAQLRKTVETLRSDSGSGSGSSEAE